MILLPAILRQKVWWARICCVFAIAAVLCCVCCVVVVTGANAVAGLSESALIICCILCETHRAGSISRRTSPSCFPSTKRLRNIHSSSTSSSIILVVMLMMYFRVQYFIHSIPNSGHDTPGVVQQLEVPCDHNSGAANANYYS